MEPIETPPSEAPRSRARLNSTIVAAGAAAALTLAGLGIAGAHTGSSSTTPGPTAPAAGAQADKPAEAAGPHGHCHGHHLGARKGLATAASTIGISEADLMTALRSGQSIADVARSSNVDVQKVVDALLAEAKKRLADKVAAGQLTQAQADERSGNLGERITALVNRAGRGPGLRSHRRPGGPEGAGSSHQSPEGERRRGFPGPGAGTDAPAPAPEGTSA